VRGFSFLLRAVAFFILLKIEVVRPFNVFYAAVVTLSLILLKLGEGMLFILRFSLKCLFFLGVKGSIVLSSVFKIKGVASFCGWGAVAGPGAMGLNLF
jgi:hypothetical protein